MTDIDDLHFAPHTALVVVDVQNDFADRDGSLYVGDGEHTVPVINRLVQGALAGGATVAYTQDWHPEVTAHFQAYGGTWPVHCVQHTWGAEPHPDLRIAGPIVRKGVNGEDGYSGFTARDVATGGDVATELDGLLRDNGVSHVVVVGLAHDVCVKATALDARRLGYDTSVVLQATRAVNLHVGDDQRANSELEAAGVTLR